MLEPHSPSWFLGCAGVTARPRLAALLFAITLAACKGKGGAGTTSAPSSTQPPPASAPSSAPPLASSGAPASSAQRPANVPAVETAAPVAQFVPAKTTKECRVTSFDLATYQQRGEVSIAGREGGAAGAWLALLGGRKEAQIGFGAYDPDAKQVGHPRGVGLSETPVRMFATGTEWTITWFDGKGLAFVRPRNEPLPAPEIKHLSAVSNDAAEDVGLAVDPSGSLVAAAPFGEGKAQLGLFLFAPLDEAAPPVKALGVTHYAKAPHHPAIAASALGLFVAWEEEGGRLVASHFDPAGKENEAPCEIVAASEGKRDRLSLTPTTTGAIASWVEGDSIKTRALDGRSCPVSGVFTIGQGKWPALVATGGTGAIVVWVGADGRLLAAKLDARGAPPEKGLDVAEGTSGVRDPPSVALVGPRVAFAWTEAMSPIISSKRVVLRTLEAACIP